MLFREYGNVKCVIFSAQNSLDLCRLVDNCKHDIIDLQYSTTTLSNGVVEYSVFLLLKS